MFDIRIVRLGLKFMSSGVSMVELNMVIMCCMFMVSVCGVGSCLLVVIMVFWLLLVFWCSCYWGKYEFDMEIFFVVDLF